MVDILAALDAAIDEIAPAINSRSSRQRVGARPATGTRKLLNYNTLPVIPVVPVPKQGNRGDGRWSSITNNAKKIGGGPHAYTSFSTGSTGTTGSLEDSCGFQCSRDGEIERDATGSTGTVSRVALDLDRLDPEHPPGDVPRRRWVQFLEDASAFRASGFAEQAKALGWTDADLFGCDDTRPFARIDCMGLVWLLKGDRIVALTAEGAVIEAKNGSRLTYRRKEWQSPPVGMLVPRFSADHTEQV